MKRISDSLSNGEAALIITPVNRRYLTKFHSSLGYLLITRNESILFVDGRYYEAACYYAHCSEVVPLKRLNEQLPEYLNKFNISKLLLEDEIIFRDYKNLKSALSIEVEPSSNLSGLIMECKSVKSLDEIEKIEKAQRIAEKAFDEVLNIIKPGISERHLALELDYNIRKFGGDDISFETIVVSGENSSLPHGVPGEREVKPGDFITFDFGAVKDGYHSDMTRTIALEYATDEMQKVYYCVLSAQIAALNIIKEGLPCGEVDKAARDVIELQGFGEYFVHSTGHGVGLKIHEEPRLVKDNTALLKSGNVVTVEPGIYIPSKFGARIEDMVVVTKEGSINLTKTAKDLIII
ncbi:MAG TPA: aminopeptidase P family protein [Clostridiales bacterium]|nr:aminopeptidase P family protein [Clostridiales bacterium]